jgi:hypothetical protein
MNEPESNDRVPAVSRRAFLGAAGAAAAVAALGPLGASGCAQAPPENLDERRPDPAAEPTPIRQAIAFGLHAANPHNTQAWRLQLLSDSLARLFVDETRLLPETDPVTRQIHVGCGCFLETLALGAESVGRRAHINLLPEGDYAPAEAGRRPLADILLLPGAGQQGAGELAAQIRRRRTSRLPYTAGMGDGDFQAALALVGAATTDIALATEGVDALGGLFLRGMQAESSTRRTWEESRRWFRLGEDDSRARRDGLTLRASGLSGFSLWTAEHFGDLTSPEGWNAPRARDAYLSRFRAALDSTKSYVFFTTPANGLRDWVQAGRDFARFQLAAAHLGHFVQPVSQVLEEYAEVRALGAELDTARRIGGQAKIQMVARVGRSALPWLSWRRRVGDVVAGEGRTGPV